VAGAPHSEGRRRPRVVAAIVRHGSYRQPDETPSAHLPHPLTARGRDEAGAGVTELLELAAHHGLCVWPAIDASRLLRAWETASIFAERLPAHVLSPDAAAALARGAEPARLGIPAHTDGAFVATFDALNERSVGAAANLTLPEIEAVIEADPRHNDLPPGWKSNSTHRLPLPGAESLLEAGARVAAHLELRMATLAAAAERDTLKIFVGHGGAFRHAAAVLGLLELSAIRGLSMHHGRPLLFERRDDGRFSRLDGAWKIRGTSDAGSDLAHSEELGSKRDTSARPPSDRSPQ